MSFFRCEFCGVYYQPFKWLRSIWWRTVGFRLYDRKIKATKDYADLFNKEDICNFNELVKLYYPKEHLYKSVITCDKHGRTFDNVTRTRS
jgi:hypothetical protein